jgi:hypothetical protein
VGGGRSGLGRRRQTVAGSRDPRRHIPVRGLHPGQNPHHGRVQAHGEVAPGTVFRSRPKLPQRRKRISVGRVARGGSEHSSGQPSAEARSFAGSRPAGQGRTRGCRTQGNCSPASEKRKSSRAAGSHAAHIPARTGSSLDRCECSHGDEDRPQERFPVIRRSTHRSIHQSTHQSTDRSGATRSISK